ncbi:cobyric acid synthase CobQ [Acidimicrobium ferrooxidans DSM 10331]|uniref:Cobyric acid synthase n=1 Tax=Acidimicrobium ferrooxidans (strain DSM 10331 / JCM 15462 / NBRC 103882 / ICP) TaxID=525909 RepID=C7LYF3_ACIFD|nr:cobyric acid synthase [Acidimicrobium ferrooxidans]ACU53761.1 cobyric acid synthase CobQ [Acidimicrobium ferrooxidans DSM 10331]
MTGALLVVGTGSNVGKSTIVTGLVRILARRGVAVAPFKGQNMALNAAVTVEGGEIGRAQAVQARAAWRDPSVLMNPILVKPTGPGRSQLVVLGKPAGELRAAAWLEGRRGLWPIVLDAFDELRSSVDVVIAEGAGSAAEINLLSGDLTNLALAEARGVPAVLVGDVDRGGVFASIYGHYTVLPPSLARHLHGFVITKLRGDPGLLGPGVRELEDRLATRCYGVVPWHEIALPAEDSLVRHRATAPRAPGQLRVGVVALPHLANETDLDPLVAEGVALSWIDDPSRLSGVDLVIVPGSKATVADLGWLRASGIAAALEDHLREGGWLLGICAGYQMLVDVIDDPVESGEGTVAGLGLVRGRVRFGPEKVLALVEGSLRWPEAASVRGYLMHHGRVVSEEEPFVALGDGQLEGARRGRILATAVHGILDDDRARRALLEAVAEDRGRTLPPPVAFAAYQEARIDEVADLLEEHLALDALWGLLGS